MLQHAGVELRLDQRGVDRSGDGQAVWVAVPEDITVADIVTAQKRLLEHLGVTHLRAVVGPSYGGFQAFQWAVTFPDFIDGIAPVVTSPLPPQSDREAGLLAWFEKIRTGTAATITTQAGCMKR